MRVAQCNVYLDLSLGGDVAFAENEGAESTRMSVSGDFSIANNFSAGHAIRVRAQRCEYAYASLRTRGYSAASGGYASLLRPRTAEGGGGTQVEPLTLVFGLLLCVFSGPSVFPSQRLDLRSLTNLQCPSSHAWLSDKGALQDAASKDLCSSTETAARQLGKTR